MSVHTEVHFEDEVCEYLAARGWLHAKDDAAKYDRARALFPADLLEWVKEAQPKAWESLLNGHGASATELLLDRVRKELDNRGSLDVLRHGIELAGLKSKITLAQFRAALAGNPEIEARYAANRLRVVRQVKYSVHNENCIDLVLFLNGLPVATIELKTDFTQSVDDAVDQYRLDRNPRPKGQAPEPLLDFPRGALVHFAVSNALVRMTTRLDGPRTQFLPFDRGHDGGAGNPPHPSGHPTAYLWEQVWQRDSWLEILGRYLVARRNDKKRIESVIFPRYHQLDATRSLQSAVLKDGAGGRYLVQHSAGSGKTNSIAWSAHFLADLHDADTKKLFDTVLVVSDRTVIDSQLREAIFDFERTTGVVATITGDSGSKSAELAEALSGTKKVVVCTIQTFPKALEKVRELAATQGKRFAVIADEAHSSQSGTAASKLKQVLSAAEMTELEEGGEISTEDVLAAEMAAKASTKGITFVAFTATPKAKTIELFGTRPDPSKPASDENLPAPFHVYSMRQAIEEGFILDVLQNYTTYKMAFKLATESKEWSEQEVERSAALKGIMRWVRLHPYNIAQKVQVVVEHYRELVVPLMGGRAKAMVVVASRKEAVRWKLAIEKYIADKGYKLGTLVAFSGEVIDPESGPDPFTETSSTLNPKLKGRDIRTAFAGGEYSILLVANKFQTGFDQPLLCAMYVDKRLAGIQAVQTLSRLNRVAPGKDTTYVLDFVNEPAEVLEAFRSYYATATLTATTDPNLVLDLRQKLDLAGYYDDFEVERVVAVQLKPGAKQSELYAAIAPVADRIMKTYKAAQLARIAAEALGDDDGVKAAKDTLGALVLFKADLVTFGRLYTFLSQIFDYGNTDIEKRAIFYKVLLPLLEFGRERDEIDLSKVRLTHYTQKSLGKQPMVLSDGPSPTLRPISEAGSGGIQEKQRAQLLEIIEKVNDLFAGDLTDQDKLVYVNDVLKGKLLESATLREQALNNTKEQFANSPDLSSELMNAIIGALDAHTTMSSQALESAAVRDGLRDILINYAGLYESLKATGQASVRN
jgi:type I restriction enzyme, R subunit